MGFKQIDKKIVKEWLCTDGIVEQYKFIKQKDDETGLETLRRMFQMTSGSFDDYFKEAIGGNGDEEENLTTIYSSALLSLLFFSSAVENGGLKLEAVPDKVFTKCYFEYKNPVLKTRPNHSYPSNVDCVLVDKEDSAIVFVESKFAEYVYDYGEFDPNSKANLKDSYRCAGEYTENVAQFFDRLVQEGHAHYYYGIKQMITHYSGICNFIEGRYHRNSTSNRKMEVINAYKNGAKVYLMEIVYDMSKIKNDEYAVITGYKTCLDDYKAVQGEITKLINDESRQKALPLTALPLTTYQQLVAFADNSSKIHESIKKFYRLCDDDLNL